MVQANQGVAAVIDHSGIIQNASIGFSNILGFLDQQPLLGRDLLEFVDRLSLPNWNEIVACIKTDGHFQIANWVSRADGPVKRYLFSISASSGVDTDLPVYLLMGVDVGDIVASTKQLELQAHQDPLTGLHNRRYLEATVGHLISACPKLGILVVDLDDFKCINDNFGHEAGDTVLCTISERLTETIPLGETVVRLGGDEFVVVIEGFNDPADLQNLAEEIRAVVRRPMSVGGNLVRLQASVGTSLFPDHGQSLKELLYNADTELYLMKQAERGPGRSRVTQRPPAAAPSNLIKALSEDLAAEKIVPFYQPIVDMRNGQIVGVEALCRWQRAGREMMLPSDFVPMAEAHNLISGIDRLIFKKICFDLASWTTAEALSLVCSFNLSAATLGKPGYSSFIDATLSRFGVDPSRLLVELTESMTLNEFDPERECIFNLRDHGIGVALDDFGTGFSSLSLLKSLPVSRLKIDRTFIRDINENEKDARIVESIVSLARSIDAVPVAEGIENAGQAKQLQQIGVNLGQGFYFGHPMPFDALKTVVEEQAKVIFSNAS